VHCILQKPTTPTAVVRKLLCLTGSNVDDKTAITKNSRKFV